MSRPAARSPVLHQHRINVETEHEGVTVSLGGRPVNDAAAKRPPVPGGFSKFFNRVIDNGTWASLPDAARAVYLPLVRLSDDHGGGSARARVGLASLVRHSGVSRSTVKRGLKALQEARLVLVVRTGGVSADGTNRPNVYELPVPEAEDGPTGVQGRTDRGSARGPGAGSGVTPASGQGRGRTGGQGRTPSEGQDQDPTPRPGAGGGG